MLEKILSVEKMLLRPGLALLKDGAEPSLALRVIDNSRHLGTGLQGCQIHALQPGVGAKKLHIQRVVLAARKHAGLLWVPGIVVLRAPGIFQRTLDPGPFCPQPVRIAADFILPVGFKNGSKLPVRAGPEAPGLTPQWQHQAERQPTVRLIIVFILQVAHGTLQPWE